MKLLAIVAALALTGCATNQDAYYNAIAERNAKLSETDWTQVADAPVDKAVWATYRQALRDVPEQAGFPWAVEWPEQPQE